MANGSINPHLSSTPVGSIPIESTAEKAPTPLEYHQVNAYLERYNPEGLTEGEGIDRLQVGLQLLKQIRKESGEDFELLKEFKERGETKGGVEVNKKFMSKILMAVDFLAKKEMGHLDADDEIIGRSSFLIQDTGGKLNRLLMECQPYTRTSTHYGGYGASKKGKYGVDFGKGLLPARRDSGKAISNTHCHFYAFEEEGKDYIGLKFEEWGWHGDKLTSYFNKEKRAHNIGHARSFIKTRDWGKKIGPLKLGKSKRKQTSLKVIDRRDTDKTLLKKADKLLSKVGVQKETKGLKKDISQIKSFFGRVKKLKRSDFDPRQIKVSKIANQAFQQLRSIKFQKVKKFVNFLLDTLQHANQEILQGQKHDVKYKIPKGLIPKENLDAFKQLVDQFFQAGRLDQFESIVTQIEMSDSKAAIEATEMIYELKEIIADRQQRMKEEGIEDAPTIGNEIVFDLSKVETKELDQYIEDPDKPLY